MPSRTAAGARWFVTTCALALCLILGSGPADAVTPSGIGFSPAFDRPVSTADGFTVNVTNYYAEYAWYASTDAGRIRTGPVAGSMWPIVVTGLTPGQSATVEVRAEMPGLDSEPGTVVGAALPAAPSTATDGAVSYQFAFPGRMSRPDSPARVKLHRLVARVPTNTTVTRVTISITAPRHATADELGLARARAAHIATYLRSQGVTRRVTVLIPRDPHPGVATVTLRYTE